MAERRRISPAKKLEILIEGLRGDSSLAEVCRRNGITTTQFYTWKKQLYKRSNAIFARERRKGSTEDKIMRENARLKEVIAEITTENLVLKKRLIE